MKLKTVLTTIAVLDLLLLSSSLPSVTEKKPTLWSKDKDILASGSDHWLKRSGELESQGKIIAVSHGATINVPEEESRRGRQYCQAGLKAKYENGVQCYYCACRLDPGFDNCFKVDAEWCRQEGIPDDQPSGGGGGSKPPSSTSSQGMATVIYCNPCTIVTTNEI